MNLKITTKIGAKEIVEKIINTKQRGGGVGLAKEKDPGRQRCG